jgi:hypothetical protein
MEEGRADTELANGVTKRIIGYAYDMLITALNEIKKGPALPENQGFSNILVRKNPKNPDCARLYCVLKKY